MQEKTELKLMLYFTIAYLALFTILSIIKENYEFLYYTIIMALLISIIVLYHKKLHLSKYILLGLTIFGAMHIFGGNIYIFNTRLYDLYLIPDIFRYDNLVHTIGSFITTIIAYSLLRPHLDKKIKHNPLLLSLILISISTGVAAYVEILELIAVLTLGASKQIGDYLNNALDLVFNLLGSIMASFFIIKYHKKKK
tara:strand:- start:5004 stop:5591 length:588 start_codon:yes stop_codon:yes gene_type:complete